MSDLTERNPPVTNPGLVLTARDAAILRVTDRHRHPTSGQISHAVTDPTGAGTARRLRTLRAAGLVRSHPVIGPASPVWTVTPAGQARIGSPLRPARVNQGRTVHTLATIDAALLWETQGIPVLTEAEIIHDGPASPWLANGRRPDLIVDPHGPDPVPVEIELNRKTPAAWTLIHDQYASSRYHGRVLWLAHPTVAPALTRTLTARPGRVHPWTPPSSSG